MDIDRDELDLEQLAKAADVSKRTIRYYVQQGLLPSPGTRGPGTKYDRSLVDRLQLIKLLQRGHQPLSEIRRTLEALDNEGVRRALGAPPELPLAGERTALGYVRSVMSRTRPVGESLPPVTLAAMPVPPRAYKEGEPDFVSPPPMRKYLTKATWERITLAPDVELHVRRPLTREQNKLVDRLVDLARTLFSEEP